MKMEIVLFPTNIFGLILIKKPQTNYFCPTKKSTISCFRNIAICIYHIKNWMSCKIRLYLFKIKTTYS